VCAVGNGRINVEELERALNSARTYHEVMEVAEGLLAELKENARCLEVSDKSLDFYVDKVLELDNEIVRLRAALKESEKDVKHLQSALEANCKIGCPIGNPLHKENVRLRACLQGVVDAVQWSGWTIDDEKWKGPMRIARKALDQT